MDWSSPEYWQSLRPERPAGWPDEHPPPLVTTRDPRPPEAPADGLGVRRLVALATGVGWSVRVGYSRGFHRAAKIGTFREVEAVGVWALREPWRWLVVYERNTGKGSFVAARTAIWRSDGLPVAGPSSMLWFVDAGVKDIQEFICREDPRPVWFKQIHAREAEKRETARANARTGTKTRREGQS